MRVLIICAQSPWPPHGGAPLRTQGWIKTAAQFVDVGVVALTRSADEAELAQGARRYCSFVKIVIDPLTRLRQFTNKALALATLMPFYYQDFFSQALRKAVAEAMAEWPPDVVQAEWIGSARYMELALDGAIPSIYSAHNLEHVIVAGPPGGLRRRLAWPFARRMAWMERYWASRATAVSAVAEADADWLRTANRHTYFVPNAVMAKEYPFKPPSQRQNGPVAFIGHLGYPPNQSAAEVLARQVFPLLRKRWPGLECIIAGRTPTRRVLSLAGNGVTVVGDVEDMAAIWSRASLLLCPLAWGAGSRVKLLEAAAWGVPFVATPISVEGLRFRPGQDYLVAHSPDELAETAWELLSDPLKAESLAYQARQTLMAEHDWTGLAPTIARIYSDLGRTGSATQGGRKP